MILENDGKCYDQYERWPIMLVPFVFRPIPEEIHVAAAWPTEMQQDAAPASEILGYCGFMWSWYHANKPAESCFWYLARKWCTGTIAPCSNMVQFWNNLEHLVVETWGELDQIAAHTCLQGHDHHSLDRLQCVILQRWLSTLSSVYSTDMRNYRLQIAKYRKKDV